MEPITDLTNTKLKLKGLDLCQLKCAVTALGFSTEYIEEGNKAVSFDSKDRTGFWATRDWEHYFNEYNSKELSFVNGQFTNKQPKPDWRVNIGKGVLCKVWDNDKSNASIQLVLEYALPSSGTLRYITTSERFKHAKPLTKKQAKKYIAK